MSKTIGILTSGGDCPGLNAAIRGVGKAAIGRYGMRVIGFRDGFRGLVENRTMPLESDQLSGILTIGGTILGTSRDKPHKMPVGGKTRGHDRCHRRQLPCPRARLPGLPGRRRHAEERPAPEGKGAERRSPCPRPSTTTWR